MERKISNKTKGKKTREEIAREREERYRIELANRDLLRCPRRSERSLGLYGFDRQGVFMFEGGRWVRVYRAVAGTGMAAGIAGRLHGRIRITAKYDAAAGTEDTFLTLTEKADVYIRAKELFAEDEKTIETVMQLEALDADGTFAALYQMTGSRAKPMTAAAFPKSRTDLLKAAIPNVREKKDSFISGDRTGISFFAMEYPKCHTQKEHKGRLTDLKECGLSFYMTITLSPMSEEEREKFLLLLSDRYSRSIRDSEVEQLLGISMTISAISENLPEEKIREKVTETGEKAGYLIASCYHRQKDTYFSGMFLGFFEDDPLRNVTQDDAAAIFEKEFCNDQRKICTDENGR